MNPRFPIFIISKGRWKRRQTVKTLEYLKVPYKICVEPNEYNQYAKVIDRSNIINLPENFSERNQGSIPVRNWVWEYAIKNNTGWHWILDDNIESVERFNKNMKIKCKSGTPFYIIEEFVLRYENISQAGMNYSIFCPAMESRPPIKFNTRIYSCILIRNDTGYKWRGKFNEDTDLSIRMLKDGWCTVLFNAFLIGKRATQTQGGGNTDTIYDKTNNRYEFAQSLAEQHPDVASITKRCGRWHHLVNYNVFRGNLLKKKSGLEIKDIPNNYNMNLIRL